MKTRLGKLIYKIIDNRGRNPKYYTHKGHPIIDNHLVKNNLYPHINDVKRCIDDNIYRTFIREYSHKDDILLTLVGNIGDVTLMPTNNAEIIQNTVGLRSNKYVNQYYLYYLLLMMHRRLISLNRGSAQPSLRLKDVLNIDVNIPPINIQKHIVHMILPIDRKIESNYKIDLDLLRLMILYFYKMTKNINRYIRLGDVAEYYSKRTNSSNFYLSTRNFKSNRHGVYFPCDSIPNNKTYLSYKRGDILISNIRPYFKKIWMATRNGSRSNDVIDINVVSHNMIQKYLYHALQDDNFFNYMTKNSKGTKMPRGDKDAILNYQVPFPTMDAQKNIVKRLNPMDNEINLNREINSTLLNKLRVNLLLKYFN